MKIIAHAEDDTNGDSFPYDCVVIEHNGRYWMFDFDPGGADAWDTMDEAMWDLNQHFRPSEITMLENDD